MLLAVVTFFGACSSDDDSWNSAADVTVSMKDSTMVIKENMGLTNVPIEVKGKTNGNVYVTLAVKEVGKNLPRKTYIIILQTRPSAFLTASAM